jgi:hypothetical protein
MDTTNEDKFVFRKHDNVGSAAAEDDIQFLKECFLDTGDLRLLLDCADARRIIVGRTGAGKSALIYQLAHSHANVARLSPHDLSLNFIATNKIIAFFEAAGVNLSPFYVLLWKHLLVVELLKSKFNIVSENSHNHFMQHVKSILYKKDRYKEQAVEYLQQWGNKFWLTTEQRVQELTERVESSLSGSIKGLLAGITFSADGAKKLTTEERKQVVEHGMDAVSKVQIRELDNMIELLAENVFEDPKDSYYVTIDMLDEDWADDRIKFKLIRALIDTVRRFKSVPYVKIILAIRQDLLDKVIHLEAVPGFQEEKYRSLHLNIQWDKKDLCTLVERRINQLVRRRYTKGDISFADVFASKVDGYDTLDYLLNRTFHRPRDIIVFVNECLGLAEGRTSISAAIIKEAEERYSTERLQSLAQEWSTIWPNLLHTSRIFYGMKDHFEVSELTETVLTEHFTAIAAEIVNIEHDPVTRSINSLYNGDGNFGSIRSFVLREFYVTGLVGIKSGPTDSISWSRQNAHARLGPGGVRPSSIVYVHPMFYRALGIKYSLSHAH